MQRIRWRNLELPTQVICEQATNTYGQFVIEPFERGFGITVGNSLRRVLLSALEGTAVCNIKITYLDKLVLHEYDIIPGILEDVPDIILNLKGLLIELDSINSAKLVIKADQKGEVTAKQIQEVPGVRIINPNYYICNLSDKIDFTLEMEVRRGRGYLTAEEHERGDSNEVGLIWIDSIFSPVRKVNYSIQNTRVGKITNYDKLTLLVETDGTIRPEMALVEASKILRKHLNPFVQYYELGQETEGERREIEIEEEEEEDIDDSEETEASSEEKEISDELREKLNVSIKELGLSNRALNCLEAEKMNTLYDIVSYTEEELLKIRNFGKSTLDEIHTCLKNRGLSLGMLKGHTV